jgi:hypothetical protein
MRKVQGYSIIELLVGILCVTILSAALINAFSIGFKMHDTVIGQNLAYVEDRVAVDVMADHIRNAQTYVDGSNGTIAIASGASATSITYYSDAAGTTVRYRLSGTNLVRTTGGTDKTVATNISSLELTYYKSSSYNGAWSTTTNAQAPADSELRLLAGVEINVSVAKDGYTNQYRSLVRLRNSPKKTALSGS